MNTEVRAVREPFYIELIKPSHYDDDGYLIQWWKAWVPSNSLSTSYGIALDVMEREPLGDDVERQVRANLKQGITRWFITNDNFARSRNWEAIFDRLGDLREETDLPFSIIIPVDTLCHQIPNFIAKANGRARRACLLS